ncbi:MAG: hypothetical protein F4188_06415 [Chloroflexi bacterium]|nr:hypothetical protein [Chloroflexota bacterium]
MDQRPPDHLFQLVLVSQILDQQFLDRPAERLGLAKLLDCLIDLGDDSLPHFRIRHLGLALITRSCGGVVPGRRGVVQIPVLQREGEGGADRGGLPEDPLAAGVALLQPLHPVAMQVGILRVDGDQVVQDRPLRCRRQLRLELQILVQVACELGDLDEALVAFCQDLCQRKALAVRHDVGHHRRAVVIGLDRILSQPLRRPTAGTGVHRLVEQTLHLGDFVIVGAPRLSRFEAHDPGHQRRERHVGQAVDALGDPIERVEELGECDPVPNHPFLH